MNKNLVIVCAGDLSLHNKWLDESKNFDLAIIYYGNSDEIASQYENHSSFFVKQKGHKWHMIKNFIKNNYNIIKNYNYFWFPDDDILSDVISVNSLFEINHNFKLSLSQPSLCGYVSYEIEKKQPNTILRFTNFVEIICPVMDFKTMMLLLDTFDLNESGWGLDYLWPKMLGTPTNKIAIIDEITVEHTRPVGGDYSRFKKTPTHELNELFAQHNLSFNQQTFLAINK
jgi:hypothetical protein